MFGYSEEQIAGFGLSFGVGGFMLYMLFIIGHLAWESKAGKFGTFVIFLGLAFGMVGFVASLSSSGTWRSRPTTAATATCSTKGADADQQPV